MLSRSPLLYGALFLQPISGALFRLLVDWTMIVQLLRTLCLLFHLCLLFSTLNQMNVDRCASTLSKLRGINSSMLSHFSNPHGGSADQYIRRLHMAPLHEHNFNVRRHVFLSQ
ncbi:hypothetical protein KP509_05G072500 [Ceratopteris richardii]|uniref:Uncharacterized protein n=1 Tax=Ceratopteris richardii TaxID=49495 RepID=A0A8T2UMT5_CERRI|nr:hypothetical protein KP509_05G072500 [Ceratopteris richardii]